MTTMTATMSHEPATASNKMLWGGRICFGLAVAFLAMDISFKFFVGPEVISTMEQLGWPVSYTLGIGILELALLALYVLPRTSVLGALLWTGYLGGAIATHVRVGNPLFSHVLFPTYVAALIWLGLWLRDARLRAILPFTAPK